MHELDDDVHPYGGEKLVSDGSFLRRMPQVVPIKERMRLDAIVTAADIIEQSSNVLRTVTAEIGTEIEKFGNIERAYIISQCWTLVDQLHAIRQLLETAHKKEPRPFTKHFLEAALSATQLRNYMDHLAKNLPNLSNKKGSTLPLFGCLSYFYSVQKPPMIGHIVTIMSGVLHGDAMMPVINPLGRNLTLPAGMFTLSASHYSLDFGRAIAALRDWLGYVEGILEPDILGQLVQQGIPSSGIEAAMASTGGGLVIALRIDFSSDAGACDT